MIGVRSFYSKIRCLHKSICWSLSILLFLCLGAGVVFGQKERVIRVAAYGDNRTGKGDSEVHRRLIHLMEEERPQIVLHMGDMVNGGDRHRLWDTFFEEGRLLFKRARLMAAVGNHDLSKDNRFREFFPYGRSGENYYAFEYGPASFVALDTNNDYAPGSPQFLFLESTLEAWKGRFPIIVFLHHPPFSGGKHGGTEKVQKDLVPLFERFGVDLVLSGHDHNYQRIGPINDVLYLVTGGGGGPLYAVNPLPETRFSQVVYHYVTLKITKDRVRGWMKNHEGAECDRFEITP